LASVVPAVSIKRRETRRQLIPTPFHYDKPLTTRVTHATASVLFGQGPPTVRVTHATAAVLYQRPTSQGHPETTPAKKGQKKKFGFIGGDTSTSRGRLRVLQPGIFTPTPPGFFEGQWPSHKPPPLFKTAFKRQLLTPPEHNEYPVAARPIPSGPGNRPFSIFKQRSRRLKTPIPIPWAQPAPPAAVPFSAYTPVLKVVVAEFERQIQKLPQLDERPPTPPGFFEGHWPGSKAVESFNVSFERQLQKLPQLDEYPETPFGFQWGFYPGSKRVEAFTWEFKRKPQTVELNEYPETPPGFFEGQWPASLTLRPFEISFERRLQQLPPLWEYPATPPGFFEGQWPASLTLRPFEISFERKRRDLPPLWEYPPTPPGFFEGFYPGSKRAESLFVSFDRALQELPKLDRFAPPPVSAEDYAAFTPVTKFSWSYKRHLQPVLIPPEYPPTPFGFQWGFYPGSAGVKSFTYEFERTIQTVELNEYPPTPPGFFEGFFPAPIRLKRIPSSYHRKALRVLDPHVYPPTPPGFFEGFYPGSAAVKSFKVSFDRSLQSVPQLDEYPPPPVAPDLFAGFTPVPTIRRRDIKRTLQTVQLDERPPTPPGFFEGHWPAPVPMPTHKTAFARRLQTLPQLDEHPATPAPAVPFAAYTPALASFHSSFARARKKLPELPTAPPTPPGFFEGFYPGSAGVRALRVSFTRDLQSLPPLWEFPPTPPVPYTAYTPVLKVIISRFERELQRLPQLDQFTPTPAGFFAGFWPGSRRVEALLVEFERQIQKLPQLDEFKATPPPPPFTAFTPVIKAHRSRFDRHRKDLPEHDEYPATPPSLIEMPAPWAAQPIYRRDIRRKLQPVWNPSPIVGEGFTPHAEDCKIWFADRGYTVWKADCASTEWKADPICEVS
jgi:hypothetical protein